MTLERAAQIGWRVVRNLKGCVPHNQLTNEEFEAIETLSKDAMQHQMALEQPGKD